jgi:hypothetical protein
MRPSLALEGPPGLRVETPPVWAPALREAAWRIRAEREGDFMLHVIVDYARIERRVRVSRGLVAASTVRPPPRILDAWLHPAEAPIPASVPVEAIAIAYPVRNIDVFDATLPWLVVLFLLSTLFALLGSRVFRITL